MKNYKLRQLIPVMLAFFTMGFVDLIGIATNHIKADFTLSDTMANLLPSMVFLWFLVFGVPTSLLMNKIGRKKTVLLSLVVTSMALLLPLVEYNFRIMLISFSLLGIGNMLIQVSINPLLSNIVSDDKLASSLTLGQFIKSLASFSAPFLAAWAVVEFGDWRILFLVFMVVAIIAFIYLSATKIVENPVDQSISTFRACIALLGNKLILFMFIGISIHVGIDVGVNLTAPKLMMERLDLNLNDAGYASSIYFLFRAIGSFSGVFVLERYPIRNFFKFSISLLVIAVIGLFFAETKVLILLCIALIGIGNANIFPMIFSSASLSMPTKSNEISGLMVMSMVGGTIYPLLMGMATDIMDSQMGAILVLMICISYFVFLSSKIKR